MASIQTTRLMAGAAVAGAAVAGAVFSYILCKGNNAKPGEFTNQSADSKCATASLKKEDCAQKSGAKGDLLEYSVVYTDRAVNHMSKPFQKVMTDISATLKEAYNGTATVVVPGSGSYAMEAVAREFGAGKRCLVIRNGYFSYRWSDIFQKCSLPASEKVLKAQPQEAKDTSKRTFAPCPIEEVVQYILQEKPQTVFCPHVETAAGMLLPEAYLKKMAAAVHEVGGLLVVDSIASGCVWLDMAALGIDVLITAPQKGWSGPACAGLVVLGPRAEAVLAAEPATQGGGFACNLRAWHGVMQAYEKGGHKYYATMPTDALTQVRDQMLKNKAFGLDKACQAQWELGRQIRALLTAKGYPSVAALGFEAPGVVVVYSPKPGIAADFAKNGMQIAGGVPLMCDAGTNKQHPGFQTFRLGLFGLDKLANIPRTVIRLKRVLDKMA